VIDDRAAQLLRAPRGRRLCLSLALDGSGWTWAARWHADPWSTLRAAAQRAAGGTEGDLPLHLLWSALVEAVDSGRYWQEPDDVDALLADPAAAEVLRPVAERLVADPGTDWW
jgi:hypothetical protein